MSSLEDRKGSPRRRAEGDDYKARRIIGAIIDVSFGLMTIGYAWVFVRTGSGCLLFVALYLGSAFARDVGHYPGGPRW